MNARSARTVFWALGLFSYVVTPPAFASAARTPTDPELAAIEFQQNLGAQVNLALKFVDESGREVQLGQYFQDKPVILVLGYYECPMLCTLVMNGMIEALEDLRWTIGNEFEVVNISIDPRETPRLAAAKKRAYLKRYGRAGAGDGWHFLTGREAEVQTVAREVGFNYLYDPASGQYAHPSGLVFLSPAGQVVRYQFGVVFKPTELLSNLQQARTGKPGSTVQKLVFLCFHYNPIQGRYGAAIMLTLRIMAAGTFLGLIGGIFAIVRQQKAKSVCAAPEPAVKGGTPT